MQRLAQAAVLYFRTVGLGQLVGAGRAVSANAASRAPDLSRDAPVSLLAGFGEGHVVPGADHLFAADAPALADHATPGALGGAAEPVRVALYNALIGLPHCESHRHLPRPPAIMRRLCALPHAPIDVERAASMAVNNLRPPAHLALAIVLEGDVHVGQASLSFG